MADTTITPELLDQLLANYSKPEDLLGEKGLLKQLKKALIGTGFRGRAERGRGRRRGPAMQRKPAATVEHSQPLYSCIASSDRIWRINSPPVGRSWRRASRPPASRRS